MEALETNLAGSSDTIMIKGKTLVPVGALASTPASLFLVHPNSFGSRTTALATLYAKYKITDLVMTFISAGNSASGNVVLGFLDDSISEGDAPSTIEALSQLRCSTVSFAGETVTRSLKWRPRNNGWYFTYAGSSGSDERLVNAATLYGATTGTEAIFTIMVNYTIRFTGAVDPNST
jgi:hypothetical protein